MAGQLVRIRSTVAASNVGESRDDLWLEGGRHQAYFRRRAGQPSAFATATLAGAEVEVSGVVFPLGRDNFRIRMRRRADLTIVRLPGQWAFWQILALAGALLGAAGATGLWIVLLRRSVAGKTREIRSLLEVAQESSRLKSEFLANMSHEIRTPLNGILGMQALALSTALSPEQRDYVHTAQSSTEHLLTIINEILDFSKIEANRIDLADETVSPLGLLRSCAEAMSAQALAKGIRLHVATPTLDPEFVAADAGRLRQVILNLVANAIKFTEQGGVTLAVSSECRPDGFVELRFSVADTGIGIPADEQGKIFDAFHQVDGSHTRRHGGTGLGLAISARRRRPARRPKAPRPAPRPAASGCCWSRITR
ncbi:MAG: hypothetical protein HY822_12745 [Acidobacteria bacterium]|nr:hypothetical protein [Acidobacteriota bacterium]